MQRSANSRSRPTQPPSLAPVPRRPASSAQAPAVQPASPTAQAQDAASAQHVPEVTPAPLAARPPWEQRQALLHTSDSAMPTTSTSQSNAPAPATRGEERDPVPTIEAPASAHAFVEVPKCMWSSYETHTYPFAALPLPGSDRARIPPCTIRFKGVNLVLPRYDRDLRVAIWAACRRHIHWEADDAPRITVRPRDRISRIRFIDVTFAHVTHLQEIDLRIQQVRYRQGRNITTLDKEITGFDVPAELFVIKVSDVDGSSDMQVLRDKLIDLAYVWMFGPPLRRRRILASTLNLMATSMWLSICILKMVRQIMKRLAASSPVGLSIKNGSALWIMSVDVAGATTAALGRLLSMRIASAPDRAIVTSAVNRVTGNVIVQMLLPLRRGLLTLLRALRLLWLKVWKRTPLQVPVNSKARWSVSFLTFATWNAFSLPTHIADFSTSSRLRDTDIILLQECRIRPTLTFNDSAAISRLLRPLPPLNRHQGYLTWDAGILLPKDWRVTHTITTNDNRGLLVRALPSRPFLGDTVDPIILLSIHVPPEEAERKRWWHHCYTVFAPLLIQSVNENSMIIAGGDWNQVFHPDDIHPPSLFRPFGSQLSGDHWSSFTFFQMFDLVDPVRQLQPQGLLWTRANVIHGEVTSARRLDGIWISRSHVACVESFSFWTTTSDHRAAQIALSTVEMAAHATAPDERGGGWWHLHPALWTNSTFVMRAKIDAEHLVHSRYALSLDAPPGVWTRLRRAYRTVLYHLSLIYGHPDERGPTETRSVIEQIDELDLTVAEDRGSIVPLQRQLRAAQQREVIHHSLLYGSRAQPGFHPTSWFGQLNRPSAMPSLRSTPTDVPSEGVVDNGRCILRFYRRLFSITPCDVADKQRATEALLQPWTTRISSRDTVQLAKATSAQELASALKHGDESSAPGPDGLTYPAYTAALCLLPHLADFYNGVVSGALDIPHGLPAIRMTLLPKKGDLSLVSNWRPLGIADVDFRIIGRMISNRLRLPLSNCLPQHQFGFLAKRSAAKAVFLLQREIDAAIAGARDPFVLLRLDQEKAYDRVDRDWLLACLRRLGVPPTLSRWLDQMYSHAVMIFSYNGHRLPGLHPETGLLQGAPESPLLYNVTLEPFLHALAGAGMQVFAFADDVTVLIRTSAQLAAFKAISSDYALASNSKINPNKSMAHFVCPSGDQPTGSSPGQILGTIGTINDLPCQFSGDVHFKHLGYPISLDGSRSDAFWARMVNTLHSKARCMDRNAPLMLLVQCANTYVLSKLWHVLRVCNLTPQTHAALYTALKKTLFFRDPIRHDFVSRPRALGGLGLINMHHMALALFGSVVADLLQSSEEFVSSLHEHFASAYGGSHAHLLVRSGRIFHRMGNFTNARRSLMDYVVYTLVHLGAELDLGEIENMTLDEYLSLPIFTPGLGSIALPEGDSYRSEVLRSGFWVYADVLWVYSLSAGRTGTEMIPRSVVPPHQSSIHYNWRDRRDRPGHAQASSGVGHFISRHWEPHWRALPTIMQDKLSMTFRHYPSHEDRSTSANRWPHIRPFQYEPASFIFPWKYLKLAGMRLADFEVKAAREWLARADSHSVVVPDWQVTTLADTAHWEKLWQRLLALKLPHHVESNVRRFFLRRVSLARHPRPASPTVDSEHDSESSAVTERTEDADWDDSSVSDGTDDGAHSALHALVPSGDHDPLDGGSQPRGPQHYRPLSSTPGWRAEVASPFHVSEPWVFLFIFSISCCLGELTTNVNRDINRSESKRKPNSPYKPHYDHAR
ncbi:unnamed protein product [Sympodiomycopsis kandeliae]